MTETSMNYPEIEQRVIERHAAHVAGALVARYKDELQLFFTPSYDDPFGTIPSVVEGALEVIENEIRIAAERQARDKLHRKLVEGIEALLNV